MVVGNSMIGDRDDVGSCSVSVRWYSEGSGGSGGDVGGGGRIL